MIKTTTTNKKPYFNADWTRKLESRMLWNFYWMQQKMMEPYIEKGHNLVELGVGSGFCSNYLRSRGYNIETIDIDPNKKPDIVCDATNWRPQKNYNGFLAFQVFEHMPFETFAKTITNAANAKIDYLYVSVPYNLMSKKILIRGSLYLAKLGNFDIDLRWPWWGTAPITNRAHLWELGDGKINARMYYEVYHNNGYEKIGSSKISYAQYNVFKLR